MAQIENGCPPPQMTGSVETARKSPLFCFWAEALGSPIDQPDECWDRASHEGEIQRRIEESVQRTARRAKLVAGRLIPALVVLAGILWLASGIYTVQPGQVGVIRTFGSFTTTTNPGL